MPMPLPSSRMFSSVLSACTLAACSPRSTGIEPTAVKKDFITRPLKPLVVKYSALAKNATGRGMSAWTITLSRKERWLGATMNGPLLGTFSSPMTVGRQLPEMRVRVVQRTPSNSSIVAHLAQGCGTDAFQLLHLVAQALGVVHHGHGSGRFQLAVGREAPADADAVESVGQRSGDVLGAVAHHHGVLRAEGRHGRRDDAGLADRTGRGRGLVCGRAPDGEELAGDLVVLKNDVGKGFRLLRRDRYGPARLHVLIQQLDDARVQAALGDADVEVMHPVGADDRPQHRRGHSRNIQQGITQLGSHHRIEEVLAGDGKAMFPKSGGYAVRYSAGRIDKSAVQ